MLTDFVILQMVQNKVANSVNTRRHNQYANMNCLRMLTNCENTSRKCQHFVKWSTIVLQVLVNF